MTRRLFAFSTLAALSRAQNSEKGTLYIYRLRIFGGGARRMTLSIDGEKFAYLQNGRFLVAKLPPGKHVLSDKDPAVNIELPVEAGKILYVRSEFVENGPFGFNTRFSVSTTATGESDMRRLKPGDKSQIVKAFE
jgi:Protein of unknown function (DUF2846)